MMLHNGHPWGLKTNARLRKDRIDGWLVAAIVVSFVMQLAASSDRLRLDKWSKVIVDMSGSFMFGLELLG